MSAKIITNRYGIKESYSIPKLGMTRGSFNYGHIVGSRFISREKKATSNLNITRVNNFLASRFSEDGFNPGYMMANGIQPVAKLFENKHQEYFSAINKIAHLSRTIRNGELIPYYGNQFADGIEAVSESCADKTERFFHAIDLAQRVADRGIDPIPTLSAMHDSFRIFTDDTERYNRSLELGYLLASEGIDPQQLFRGGIQQVHSFFEDDIVGFNEVINAAKGFIKGEITSDDISRHKLGNISFLIQGILGVPPGHKLFF